MLLIKEPDILEINADSNIWSDEFIATLATKGEIKGMEYAYGFISLYDGSLLYNDTDVEITEQETFEISKTFHSASTSIKGAFGYGTSSLFDQKLVEIDESTYLLYMSDGYGALLKKVQDNKYVSEDGEYTLTENIQDTADENGELIESITYKVENLALLQYVFNGEGKITSVENKKGMLYSISYDEDGRLSGLQTKGGRIYGIKTDRNGSEVAGNISSAWKNSAIGKTVTAIGTKLDSAGVALKEAWDNSSIGQFASKALNSVSAFYEKHKTVINIIVGAAVIGLCVAATVATAGTCGLAAMAAAGAIKGAAIGSAVGAIKGAAIGSAVGAIAGAAGGTFKGALSYMEENDTLDGSGSHILEESAKGFSKGAITGAVSGAMAGAAKYAKNPSGYCFVSGTLVLTLAGLIAIENVRPGDIVYAKEAVGIEQSVDTDAQATLNSVLEIYEREVYETYRLTIDGEEIETTANHPFYTEDGEAVEAKDLKEGDKLSTADGESATVERTEKVVHDEPVKVY